VVVWDVSGYLENVWRVQMLTIWKNRVTAHSAIIDWATGERRHLARITPQAERPFETPYVATEDNSLSWIPAI
jgi:taurine dioxygenase/sulfonate dioxygenase